MYIVRTAAQQPRRVWTAHLRFGGSEAARSEGEPRHGGRTPQRLVVAASRRHRHRRYNAGVAPAVRRAAQRPSAAKRPANGVGAATSTASDRRRGYRCRIEIDHTSPFALRCGVEPGDLRLLCVGTTVTGSAVYPASPPTDSRLGSASHDRLLIKVNASVRVRPI